MKSSLLFKNSDAADRIITFAFVGLVVISLLSATAYLALGGDENNKTESNETAWVDPVVEIEDEQHSHTDLLAHRFKPTTCFSLTITTSTAMETSHHHQNSTTLQGDHVPLISRTSDQPPATRQKYPLKAISWKTV